MFFEETMGDSMNLVGSEVFENGLFLFNREEAESLLNALEAAFAVAEEDVGDLGSDGLRLESFNLLLDELLVLLIPDGDATVVILNLVLEEGSP